MEKGILKHKNLIIGYLKDNYDSVKIIISNPYQIMTRCKLEDLEESHWVTAEPFPNGIMFTGEKDQRSWEIGTVHL